MEENEKYKSKILEILNGNYEQGSNYVNSNECNITVRHSLTNNIPTTSYPVNNLYIHHVNEIDESTEWENKGNVSIIFSFSGGWGVYYNTWWADMTFSDDSIDIDIHPYDDWMEFDRVCLTDDLRDKHIDFIMSMELLKR